MKKIIAAVIFGGTSLVAGSTSSWAAAGTTLTSNSTTPVSLSSGTETINSGVTLNIGSGAQAGTGTVAITVTGNSSIVNNGTVEELDTSAASAQNGRAVRVNTANVTLNVTNNGTMVTGDADVVQVNKASDSITFTNTGTLNSMNASGGGAQAIDFNAITTGSNLLSNSSTGLIEASQADAVRPGVNGVVQNDGRIVATAPNGSTSSDGIDAQTNSGVSITNAYTQSNGTGTGTIEGARHGITGGNTTGTGAYAMTITNNNGGTIQGDDGSGINIDGINGNELVTITNHGTISGSGVTGDGDGVDVDGLVNLTNTGTIISKKALNDTSEGVTVGGGTIVNSGTIEGDNINGGVGRGITLAGVDKDSGDNPIPIQTIYANSSVDNSGLIKGQTDSAIAVEGVSGPTNFTVTITNEAAGKLEGAGTNAVIEAAGTSNNDTVNNYGTIVADGTEKAVELGGGTNTLSILGGTAAITGDISGGAGTSTMVINPGAGNTFNYNGAISNFSGGVQVKSGTTTLTGANTYSGGTTLTGGTLQIGNGTSANGSLGTGGVSITNASLTLDQSSASSLSNNIAINGGGIVANSSAANTTLSGSLTGAGTLNQGGSGTTTLTGSNSGFTGTTNVNSGTLAIASSTALAAGTVKVNSGGTLLFSASGVNQTGANITLNGGTLSLASAGTNATEAMGSLTLTANSTIMFGGANSNQTLTFSGLTFSGPNASSLVLTVSGWSGQEYSITQNNDPGTASQDRLLFTDNPGVTTAASGTPQFQFDDDSGNFISDGKQVTYEGGPDNELVPAPEPATYLGALGLLILAAYRERRRLAGLLFS